MGSLLLLVCGFCLPLLAALIFGVPAELLERLGCTRAADLQEKLPAAILFGGVIGMGCLWAPVAGIGHPGRGYHKLLGLVGGYRRLPAPVRAAAGLDTLRDTASHVPPARIDPVIALYRTREDPPHPPHPNPNPHTPLSPALPPSPPGTCSSARSQSKLSKLHKSLAAGCPSTAPERTLDSITRDRQVVRKGHAT